MLFFQAAYSTLLLLYAWDVPDRSGGVPYGGDQRQPKLRFSLLLPARHEERVIAQTIRQLRRLDYPRELTEIIVICEQSDVGTIRAARDALAGLPPEHGRVVTFADGPVNKPHGLNKGLAVAGGDVVAVFDAEDDVQPGILRMVNTIMLEEPVDLVQGAVQLMNHESRWYSALNCVEYFLWFNSRLHHDAWAGALPLAGNTLFARRSLLETVDGWDDQCLTEDADLGFRLSAAGARFRVFSMPALATREETPNSVAALVRQRTRWHQGFIQVLLKGDWVRLRGMRARLLALHTLTQPLTTSLTPLLWPLAGAMIVLVKLPTPLVLVTFLPLYALALNLLAQIIGYYYFTQGFGLRFRILRVVQMVVGFIPYTWILAVASFRAIWRQATGRRGWEKTDHAGSHRAPLVTPGQDATRPAPLFPGKVH